MDKTARMKELIAKLGEAAKAYYAEDREIMSNYEYDKLYDELTALEEETGTVMAGSPTISVGYEAVDELPKERHEAHAFAGKNKEQGRAEGLAGRAERAAVLEAGRPDHRPDLPRRPAVQGRHKRKRRDRGSDHRQCQGICECPAGNSLPGELVLRGEAVITYEDFRKINEQIEDADARYKNPRNLCSGSVRQLNNEITAQRNVRFFAFALVRADGVDFQNSRKEQFIFLKKQGFEVVEYQEVDAQSILSAVEDYESRVAEYDVPSDGLVLIYDDIAYGQSLGRTAKFPRDSIAFKWADETAETTLQEIEWSASRTGLINPVAIFDPVELEGTTVSRASVHNVSIVKALKLGIGDRITVYKANMIIPQIAENLTGSDTLEIPHTCPVCGGVTRIEQVNDVQSLYCTNPDCDAKKVKSFTLFVSRDA